MEQQSIMRFFGLKKDQPDSLKRKRLGDDEKRAKVQKIQRTVEAKPITSSLPNNGTSESSKEANVERDGESLSEGDAEDAAKLIKLSEQSHKHKDLAEGNKLPYSAITNTLEKIEHESSRLKITALVSEFFLETLEQYRLPDKLVKIVYLFINRLGPDYEPDLELGLGETLLIKAISECYGRAPAHIKKDYHEVGDLGLVAQKSRSGQPTMFKPAPLDVETVFENLTKIAKATGKDSQAKKVGIIHRMLTACDLKSNEAKFLIRSLEGKLRVGLAEKTVLVALAQALLQYEKKGERVLPSTLLKAEDTIKEAFSLVPNYEIVIRKSFEHGILNLLDHCSLTPGVPLKPMLAKPTKSVGEILDRFQGQEFTCEYKYDSAKILQ